MGNCSVSLRLISPNMIDKCNTICDLFYLYDHKKTQHLFFTLKILIWKAETRPLSSQRYFSLHRKQVLYQNAIFLSSFKFHFLISSCSSVFTPRALATKPQKKNVSNQNQQWPPDSLLMFYTS